MCCHAWTWKNPSAFTSAHGDKRHFVPNFHESLTTWAVWTFLIYKYIYKLSLQLPRIQLAFSEVTQSFEDGWLCGRSCCFRHHGLNSLFQNVSLRRFPIRLVPLCIFVMRVVEKINMLENHKHMSGYVLCSCSLLPFRALGSLIHQIRSWEYVSTKTRAMCFKQRSYTTVIRLIKKPMGAKKISPAKSLLNSQWTVRVGRLKWT